MLSSAIWFSVAPETENKGFQTGFIIFSYEEAAVGFLTNLVSFPMVFFLVFLFKYSKAKALRENRLLKALMGGDSDEETDEENDEQDNDSEEDIAAGRPNSNTSNISSNTVRSFNEVLESDKFSLPSYCVYIGWLLCFLCSGGSIFFLWAYGITFGNDTTFKWLTSLIFSFFTNFCVFEPLKVSAMSCK